MKATVKELGLELTRTRWRIQGLEKESRGASIRLRVQLAALSGKVAGLELRLNRLSERLAALEGKPD